MLMKVLATVAFAATLFGCSECYIVSDVEIAALQDLYVATNGQYWAWQYPLSKYGQIWNFIQQPVRPCNNWQGIKCLVGSSNITATVETLRLKDYNLNGTLPPSLQYLTNATVFDLDSNYLRGTIPATFSNMTWLEQLRLSYNSISGTIPHMFFTIASNLSYLSLTENDVTGTLPNMTTGHSLALCELFCNGNYLTGTIPETIHLFENLVVFFVGYNNMHGTIPESLYSIKTINRMAVNDNYFTGTVSNAISGLQQVRYLYMQGNTFTSTVPSAIGSLSFAVFITMFENFLTGSFPTSIGQLSNLRSFALDTNLLSGTIPPELGNCLLLEEMNLYSNMLTGTLPSSLSQLPLLQLVLVQSNHLTGNPGSAFNRTAQVSMRSIDLSINKFSGQISASLFGSELLSFSAFQTCFTGSIPPEVCDSYQLQSLVLDGLTSECAKRIWPRISGSPRTIHELTGGIPECIWSALPNLTTLHLSSNGLSGTIPSLASYGNLSDLDLSFNLLSGPVPEVLQGWPKLKVLNLKSNRFCGDITGTGALHFAYHDGDVGTELTLSENRFSGIIPLQIESAVQVDVVSGNMFSCTFEHLPPYNDPNGRTYVCGSNLLYVSMASLASSLGLLALVLLALFGVAYYVVRRFEVETTAAAGSSGTQSASFATVRRSMLAVFSTAAGTNALYLKVTADADERFKYIKGLVVRLVGWKRHVDALVATEDMRHDKVTRLGALLKEALLSDQDDAEGSAVHLLQGTNVAALKSANVPHLVQFLKSMRLLRNTGLVVFLLQLVMTVPAFPILKHFRGTFLYQYGWYMSGAFVSGYEPCVAIILIWFIALSVVLYAIVRYIPSRKALNYRVAVQNRAYELLVLWRRMDRGGVVQDASNLKQLAAATVPAEIEPRSSYTVSHVFAALSRATTINREDPMAAQTQQREERGSAIQMTSSFSRELNHALSKPSVAGAQQMQDESSPEFSNRSHTTNDGSMSSSVRNAELNKRTWIGYATYYLRESVAVSIAAILFDIIVVLSIKGLFLYSLNSNKTSFGVKIVIELSLSCVDLVWSVMFVPTMITRLPRMKPAGKMILKIALLYFNSILAPCLATAFTEDDCFNGMFVEHRPVNELFQFSFCALFDPANNNHCLVSSSWETTIKYTPPFLYNFNCYSNVIVAYSPVFLFSYCILALALPAASVYITTLTKRRWFLGVVPGIFWLDGASNTSQATSGDASSRPASQATEAADTKLSSAVAHPLHGDRAPVTPKKGIPQVDSCASLVSQLSDATTESPPTGSAAPAAAPTDTTVPQKPRRVRSKGFLFFPGYILASAIHHLLVLITFGLMLPVLGLAIVAVMLITTCTWELVIGRYLAQSPNCDPSRWLLAEASGTASSAASVDGASTDRSASQGSGVTALTATQSEGDCSGGLDALCVQVACCARKCKVIIAYGSAAVFAFAVLDMASDNEFVKVAIWAPITVLVLPLLLLAGLKASRIGTADQAAYEDTCAQQATTETMMLMRGTVVNDEVLNAMPNRYTATQGSRFSQYNGGEPGDAV